MRRVLCLAGLSLLTCLPFFAQTLGEITGEVRDAQGAVIPGADVAVTNIATNVSRATVSNDAGVYAFPALPPGTYNLRVSKAGFKTAARTAIEIQVQQSARVDIELAIGQVTETVEVSG